MKKILYGICGIGNGHMFRQIPILTQLLSDGHKVIAFGYGRSLDGLLSLQKKYRTLSVAPVDIPYVVGTPGGLDFKKSAQLVQPGAQALNFEAMNYANDHLGKPDLVISDYEPTVAQYAYAFDAPLVTIDQQSKYLFQTSPNTLSGTGYTDEIMRLRLFFPKAQYRIACSFFDIERSSNYSELEIVPAPIRLEIQHIKNIRSPKNLIGVYFSEQQISSQPLDEISDLFASHQGISFQVYLPKSMPLPQSADNTSYYHHGDPTFMDCLQFCSGLITTAGHSLLSEAMYLHIPVLALPILIYEQQMNARVVADGGFGCTSPQITQEILASFIKSLSDFKENIRNQTTLLPQTDPHLIYNKLQNFL